jgi:hypothetical protein
MLPKASEFHIMSIEFSDIKIDHNKSVLYPRPSALVCVLFYQGLRL